MVLMYFVKKKYIKPSEIENRVKDEFKEIFFHSANSL